MSPNSSYMHQLHITYWWWWQLFPNIISLHMYYWFGNVSGKRWKSRGILKNFSMNIKCWNFIPIWIRNVCYCCCLLLIFFSSLLQISLFGVMCARTTMATVACANQINLANKRFSFAAAEWLFYRCITLHIRTEWWMIILHILFVWLAATSFTHFY